ncbi:hypothetical protein FRB96_005345 [Tulasnella sp. 330]|nr:hypothetical protein FRB96_005345 [Tulasnella sp. 330]KAG8875799.1 hypothetical protein FRB97_004717 [Tulasnella sp. 331]KAG8881647.1 hypothetical protein FRB98_004220 [Tulasnella sp. 332]
MTRTLRFQQLDGLDFSVVKPLAELIARKGCQPLLRLAHAESLIDKVPATELTSMDLAMIVASGYYMRAHRSANQSLLQGNIRIKGGHNTILMWWSSANEDHGRKYMDCFPFIDPQDDLLKMWDMEAKRAVAVSALKKTLMEPANGSNSVVGETKSETAARGARTISRGRLELDGFHANHVKQKWPGMYELIRKMGYWKDAESQTGTTT